LVIKPHWWHVGQHYRPEIPNVDAYLHGGCDAEYINGIDCRNRLSLLAIPEIYNDVTKIPLALGLIIRLCCQFLTVQAQWLP
jgi:hypothetical protein